MLKLKDANDSQLNNFSNIVNSLLTYINKYWTGTIRPKGYKRFIENYEDYKGIGELDHNALKEEFKGIDASGVMSYPFPIQMSLPHTAYNDAGQGRNPLNTLVSSVLGHGMLIGEERAKRKAKNSIERIRKTIKTYEKFGTGDDLKEMIEFLKSDIEMIELELK